MPSLQAAAGARDGGDAGLGDPLLVDANDERLAGAEGSTGWLPMRKRCRRRRRATARMAGRCCSGVLGCSGDMHARENVGGAGGRGSSSKLPLLEAYSGRGAKARLLEEKGAGEDKISKANIPLTIVGPTLITRHSSSQHD
ncbi:hypothetical protein E2562_000930 [Oryza meyeriana var. granulata]|uniref:Uncharacterized protein n=1 Tax=Oryza meyeriana var. granulata TaxID=110450 RepID=A0A6G1D076_9ORYZ|nr:hypothetical protein E2562_000930 [Oryza meyeriana var. granulata]